MPTNMYKRSAAGTTALTTAANWDAGSAGGTGATGVVPNSNHTAYWQSTSLGGTLTGNISPDSMYFDGSSNVVMSGAIGVGPGGIAFATTNSRIVTFSGGLTPSADQTWNLYNTLITRAVEFSGTFSLRGSRTVTLNNASATASGSYAYVYAYNTGGDFTGKLALNPRTSFAFNGTGASNALGPNATIEFLAGNINDGNGAYIYHGTNSTSQTLVSNVLASGLATFSCFNGRAITATGTFEFVDGSAGILVDTDANNAGMVLQGPVKGTSGFTKRGVGYLFITGSARALSNTTPGSKVSIAQGSLVLGTVGSGACDQLSAVSAFDVTSLLEYHGNSAYTEDATITGPGQITNWNVQPITYSGDLSGATGYFFVAPINGQTTGLSIYSNVFPSNANLVPYFRSAGALCTHRYTGSANVTTAKDFRIGGNAAGTSGTAVLDNASPSGATLTLSGNAMIVAGASISTATFRLNVAGTAGETTVAGQIKVDAGASGTLGFDKTGAGRAVLSGNNTYTGATSISDGTLSAQHSNALGGASANVTVAAAATLEVANNAVLAKSGSTLALSGKIVSPSGTNGYATASLTLAGVSANVIQVDANSFALTSTNAPTGGSTLQKIGAGELVLSLPAHGGFQALDIQNGTVTVSGTMAAASTNSCIGNGSTADHWKIGSTATAGTFKYVGNTASTARPFKLGTAGATIDASCTAANTLELSGTPSFSDTAACALTLAGSGGTSAAYNRMTSLLQDNAGGALSLNKTGSGAWQIRTQPQYTGKTTVGAGTLSLNGLELGTDIDLTGACTLTDAVLTGVNKPIYCAAGGINVVEVVATSNTESTRSGTTTVASGILKLTTEKLVNGKPFKVLGNSNVVVTTGNTLQTTRGTMQLGKMSYGGNLSFQANSTLRIGNA